MLMLKFLRLYFILAFLETALGNEFSASTVFEGHDSSAELSNSLGMLNFDQQSLEDTTFDTQSQVAPEIFQDPQETSTIGNVLIDNSQPSGRDFRIGTTNYYEQEITSSDPIITPPKNVKRTQELFSINKVLSKYSKEELVLLNEYLISFSLMISNGIKRLVFKKYRPSHIRSKFATMYVERFGGSKTKALLKLREFEKALNLKYSAARRLFKSQFRLLTSTLNSAESLMHLSENMRFQPTYITEPILTVNKVSYNKLLTLCKKKSRKINIVLVSASSELIPKKFRKSDLNESYYELPKLSKTIQSFQESILSSHKNPASGFGTTQCKWNSSKKKRKNKFSKSGLKCFFKSKKQLFMHIHYYDITNAKRFKNLMQVLLKHKPNPYSQNVYPLIIIPVLMGIPQIGKNGSILGLNSITQVKKKKKRFGKPFNSKKKKRSERKN